MGVPRPRRTVRAILVVMIASLAGALLPGVPASAVTPHLVGAVESVRQTTASSLMYVVGWVADTNRPSVSVHVSIWVDGKRMLVVPANVSRPDVNTAHHLTGRHGFRIQMRARPDAKSVVIRPYNNTHPDVASRSVV